MTPPVIKVIYIASMELRLLCTFRGVSRASDVARPV